MKALNEPRVRKREDSADPRRSSILASVLSWLAAGALLVAAFWVIILAREEFRSDFSAAPFRFLVQRWAEGKAAPAHRSQWDVAVAQLRQASDIQPDDPELHQLLGKAWAVGTVQRWSSPIEQVVWLEQAQFHFRIAARFRPHDALTWALLASSLARAGSQGAELEQAVQNALRYGPNESHVHQALLPVVFQHWDRLSPDLQTWADRLYERGNQSQRASINRLGERFGRKLPSGPMGTDAAGPSGTAQQTGS